MPAAARSQTASKKSAPGGKHHASEGRASAKNNIFGELLLPAAARSQTASKKSAPGAATPRL